MQVQGAGVHTVANKNILLSRAEVILTFFSAMDLFEIQVKPTDHFSEKCM